MDVKRIGFDFDKVFVSYPPIIPDKLIDFLYKGKVALLREKSPKNLKLEYRMPGDLEKKIRIISHSYLFRPPISKNIKSLRLINKKTNHKLFLISSRFSFLKDRTNYWLDRNKLKEEFFDIHFNYNNLQPHIFKERMIKKNKITDYVDDDLDLLVYTAQKLPDLNFYWLTDSKKSDYKNLPKNIKIVKSVREIYTKYL